MIRRAPPYPNPGGPEKSGLGPLDRFDYVLVGAGLQNALLALALRHHKPGARLAVVERAPAWGGNHTWSFHGSDLPASARAWVEPLIVKSWPGYRVAFPNFERTLPGTYSSISSARMQEVLSTALGEPHRTWFGTSCVGVEEGSVELSSGETLRADMIVDARGPSASGMRSVCGFQKFVGLELLLARPHQMALPMLMDATVTQKGGFRFLYVLPFSETRVLVENTTYARSPDLDEEEARAQILIYAASIGLDVLRVVRQETGALPLPAKAHIAPTSPRLVRGGYGGGWFHPTTGYSLPSAVRLAECVATTEGHQRDAALRELAARQLRQASFGTMLNRMMFTCCAEDQRWNMLADFYRLPSEVIARFYSMNLTVADKMLFFCKRPPRGVSLRSVLSLLHSAERITA